jgi:hypothetical protein
LSPARAARRRRRLVGLGLRAGALEREQQPLDPGAEADARRGLAAELLDQAVVAAAAADRALRADRLVDELERGARVVVEAAHERRASVNSTP